MSLLSAHAKNRAAELVEEVILSSGQEAILYRPESGEQLYGSDDASFVKVGKIPIEMVATRPEELKNNVDATACVLPHEAIHAEDKLELNCENYRVQTVTNEHLFGIVTHIVLKLVKLHGNKHQTHR